VFDFGDEHLSHWFKTEVIDKLQPKIENYQLTKLARQFANCLDDKKDFGWNSDPFNSLYMPILIDKMFDTSKPQQHMFHSDFLDGGNE
jgi:hypothetical protein